MGASWHAMVWRNMHVECTFTQCCLHVHACSSLPCSWDVVDALGLKACLDIGKDDVHLGWLVGDLGGQSISVHLDGH